MSSAQDLPPTSGSAALRKRASLAVVPDLSPELDAEIIDLRAGVDVAGEIQWDDDEFEAVLRRATPRLTRFAQRRLGNLHEAEEVAQEAMLRTYQHRHTLATENDVMAWATFASNRLVIDRLRVRGRSISVAELPEGRRVARDTAEIAEARAEARLALDALDALPARQAAVLWAREVEGFSYEEISERYGLSEPTVRSLLHRARKALRREYATRGGTLFSGVAILGPWLNPLGHAKKIRTVASAALTTTALGFAGITAIGIGQAPETAIKIAPQVAPVAAPAPIKTVKAPAPKITSTVAPVITATTTKVPLLQRPIPVKACANEVGLNCATPQKSKFLYVGGLVGDRIYVGADDLSCSLLNSLPAASPLLPSVAGCVEQQNTPDTQAKATK